MNEDYVKDYLDYLKIDKKYSPHTILSYEANLKHFLAWLKKDVCKVNKKDLEAFLSLLSEEKQTSSIAHYITVLKEFYKFLEKEGFITNNPSLYLEMPKVRKKLPSVLSEEEVSLLLDISLNTPIDFRNKAMLELMYSTGLRISELLEIKVHEINLEEASLKVMEKDRKNVFFL